MATEYKLSYSASDINTKLGEIDTKVNLRDIANNLTTDNPNKPLSAAQGVALKGLIDNIDVPTKTSQLTNDNGFITVSDIPEVPVQSVNGKTGAVNLSASDVGALPNTTVIPTVPASLKNPNAMTIDSQSYDGSNAVDFTNVINNIIDTKMCSVKVYGAVGDGTTDDTVALATAMKENRVVFVPGGTYKLSNTLVIPENCCLELSQDTVLKFTQTSDNCIEMRGSATLRGNHAVICVPYEFTGNVIDINTLDDGTDHATSIPPYTKSSPQFKRQRFVYDVNIVKFVDNYGSIGFCHSKTGDCSGKAIYISATNVSNDSYDIPWMWALTLSGIRIAGAFSYGIHAINYDSDVGSSGHYTDDAWNHDMRIEATIEACEVGVALENCNGAHLQVTIQPNPASDGTKYAKYGVYLKDSGYIDMSGSRIWDWFKHGSWESNEQYQHIAMIDECHGLILDDYLYYEEPSRQDANGICDPRKYIYTNLESNLEKMNILQEPITRWFRPVNNEPYFFDGNNNKRLALQEEVSEYFATERIQDYVNILDEAGYKEGYILDSSGVETSGYGWNVVTGFIPCSPGDVIYTENLSFDNSNGYCGIWYYNENHEFKGLQKSGTLESPGQAMSDAYYQKGERTDIGLKITLKATLTEMMASGKGYVRLVFYVTDFGTNPVISVNNEIKFVQSGFIADGIKVKGSNLVLYSPNGTPFSLSVSDTGEPIFTEIEV